MCIVVHLSQDDARVQEGETPQNKKQNTKGKQNRSEEEKTKAKLTRDELYLYPLFYCMDISYNKVIRTIC